MQKLWKLTQLIVGVCCGLYAAYRFSARALEHERLLAAAKDWPSANGTILESTLGEAPDKKKSARMRIRYEFWPGEKLEGDTPRCGGNMFWSRGDMAALVARHQPGREVRVYYDPVQRTRNCLDRKDRSGANVEWLFAGVGALVAIVLPWLALRHKEPEGESAAEPA
ncbi:MAG: DUF3592 domain-containing protein [Elusimicrobia bacterium]|nr:DUF3592 domain-containing protein [Elusimicrobiota bacterium]